MNFAPIKKSRHKFNNFSLPVIPIFSTSRLFVYTAYDGKQSRNRGYYEVKIEFIYGYEFYLHVQYCYLPYGK